MDIYFYDLNERAQEAVLQEAGIKSAEDANWDVYPLAVIDFENIRYENATEIVNEIRDWDNKTTKEEILEELKTRVERREIVQELYDYIEENWECFESSTR